MDNRAQGDARADGEAIGGYRIVRTLGQSAFAITYQAHDPQLDRQVVIKELFVRDHSVRDGNAVRHPDKVGDVPLTQLEAHFRNEGRAMASASHPALVGFIAFFNLAGAAFLVTDFIEGPTLQTYLSRRTTAPDNRALRAMFAPLLDALEVLHRTGLLHGDIKPSNIVIGASGPVLIDLGAGRSLAGAAFEDAGLSFADLSYGAPEQLDGRSRPLDASTDIYALAATIYAAASGGPPVPARERLGLVAEGHADPNKALRNLAEAPALETVCKAVDWGLALDPHQRPQSVSEFRGALGWGAGRPMAAATSDQATPQQAEIGSADTAPTRDPAVLVRALSETALRAASARPELWAKAKAQTRRYQFSITPDSATIIGDSFPQIGALAPARSFPRRTFETTILPSDPPTPPLEPSDTVFLCPDPEGSANAPRPSTPTAASPPMLAETVLVGAAPRADHRASPGRSGGDHAAANSANGLIHSRYLNWILAGSVGVLALAIGAQLFGKEISAGLLGVAKLLKLSSLAAAPAPAPELSDTVDVSVFAPPKAQPGDQLLVQVFLHAFEDDVQAQTTAVAADPSTQKRGEATLDIDVARGERLEVAVDAPGLIIEEPSQAIVWRGRSRSVQFLLTVPLRHVGGAVQARVRILRASVPVAQVRFVMSVEARAPALPLTRAGKSAQRFSRAFLSYAHEDRVEVLKRAQALRAAKIEVFQDLLSLSPGDEWRQRLESEIDQCDLFLLFWSAAARRSEWVNREVDQAIAVRERSEGSKPEIMPVILEGPPPPAPPERLKHLHFDDGLCYVIAATPNDRVRRERERPGSET